LYAAVLRDFDATLAQQESTERRRKTFGALSKFKQICNHPAGASLFPASINEMKTACSRPDWSNPCKHIATVFYLVGEEFDRDPFLLFRRARARARSCSRSR
jgi:uncharacterized Zn finger protein